MVQKKDFNKTYFFAVAQAVFSRSLNCLDSARDNHLKSIDCFRLKKEKKKKDLESTKNGNIQSQILTLLYRSLQKIHKF